MFLTRIDNRSDFPPLESLPKVIPCCRIPNRTVARGPGAHGAANILTSRASYKDQHMASSKHVNWTRNYFDTVLGADHRPERLCHM
jgi:hypothetical protein